MKVVKIAPDTELRLTRSLRRGHRPRIGWIAEKTGIR